MIDESTKSFFLNLQRAPGLQSDENSENRNIIGGQAPASQ